MFSNFVIGLLAGLGFGAWVYAKVRRTSGGNTQSALVVAGCAAGITLVVIMIALSFIPNPS